MSALKDLCDIIQAEMGLSDGQVYLYKQKFDVPPDQRLYVAVGVNSCKPYSNQTRYVQQSTLPQPGLAELQTTHFIANISLDIMSRSTEALTRKEEVVMALNSQFSHQTQQAKGFLIARIPTQIVNLSEVEGAAIPYRFNVSVNIQYKIEKLKQIDYYSTFTKELTTEA